MRFARLRRTSAEATADAGRPAPSSRTAILSQRCRQASEIPKSFAIWRSGASPLRATAMTSARNSAGNGFGTRLILPARRNPHRSGVNQSGGNPFRFGRPLNDTRHDVAGGGCHDRLVMDCWWIGGGPVGGIATPRRPTRRHSLRRRLVRLYLADGHWWSGCGRRCRSCRGDSCHGFCRPLLLVALTKVRRSRRRGTSTGNRLVGTSCRKSTVWSREQHGSGSRAHGSAYSERARARHRVRASFRSFDHRRR